MNCAVHKLKNLIGGVYREASSGKYFTSYNPATGQPLCEIPDSNHVDIDMAVAAAKAAFPKWSQKTRLERATALRKLADLLEERQEDFVRWESQDQGKTLAQARDLELPRCSENLRHFANALLNLSETATLQEGPVRSQTVTRREPIGTIGVISPWNLPLYLFTWKIAPALAMGNCVVAKPSEMTSLTAYKFGELAELAGLPPGTLNIVFGYGSTAGQAIVEHPEIKAVSFTGGTVTGRKIASLAGSRGKKLSLELGGKNPAIILDDCDLDQAVATTARSSFLNQGEICLSTSRIYVHRNIYEEFMKKFIVEAQKWTVGNPLDLETKVGALISNDHLSKVISFIEIAENEGAKIHLGGFKVVVPDSEGGFFMAPTILSDVPHGSRVTQEEIFGPVTCVYSFESDEEASNLANDVQYGLAASIYSKNGQRAERLAQSIKAGVIWINTWMVRDLPSPFGGLKASGYGKEGGHYSLDFVSDIKTITTLQ